ncbi:7 transmembrane receptor [Necator americanus]|uniref:7 transmembrane receptor n=1 Tax=Necator americanus TaxID=51031 RepID=W2TJM8_NECAM|nr:7 transmembrane receptor [Necator americanus]ETN81222.1 7 transmembrane receptor [Necator americanus]
MMSLVPNESYTVNVFPETVQISGNSTRTFLLTPNLATSKYTSVQDVLPPPNNEDLHVVVMAISYLLLFLLGTCGNVAVLTTIYHVVRSSKAALDNTLIYLVVLSCVDFGVCLSLPFTVIDQILGFWMFGTVPCKLHAVFENFGKILSALILAAMSFDRYAGVCHPQKKFLRSRKLAITILIGLAAYALITLCPLLWSFTSREIIMFARETGYRKITRMKIEKCTVDIDSQMFTAFTIYQFVLCYCTPLILIAYFYSKLLKKLREHARTFKSSHIPLMRISLYTLAVACFYFLCWTPFWMATVFAVYLENTGALNGQLQQRYRGRRSSKTTLTTRTAPQSTGKPAPTVCFWALRGIVLLCCRCRWNVSDERIDDFYQSSDDGRAMQLRW